MVFGGCLDHSDCKVAEFQILGDRRKTTNKNSALDRRRADSRLMKELVSNSPWESAFEVIGVYVCWSLFKSHLLKPQKQTIPKCQKPSK